MAACDVEDHMREAVSSFVYSTTVKVLFMHVKVNFPTCHVNCHETCALT